MSSSHTQSPGQPGSPLPGSPRTQRDGAEHPHYDDDYSPSSSSYAGGSRLAMRGGGVPRSAAHGSRTLVITANATATTDNDGNAASPVVGILSLTGAATAAIGDATEPGSTSGGHIVWDESVVDNEGLGRKSSKVCCIFRKQRAWDESDSDSSDFSSSDSDSDSDDSGAEGARPAPKRAADEGNGYNGHHHHGHHHHHHPDCDEHDHGPKKAAKLPGPNAYERQPKYKRRPGPPAGPAGPSS
ncbi:phosphatase inhibitor-domain-containing protein [Blastocladiella britannica]|nr:phosphatase inhibitor-domain-containing protein [Blastocladiella britannica]